MDLLGFRAPFWSNVQNVQIHLSQLAERGQIRLGEERHFTLARETREKWEERKKKRNNFRTNLKPLWNTHHYNFIYCWIELKFGQHVCNILFFNLHSWISEKVFEVGENILYQQHNILIFLVLFNLWFLFCCLANCWAIFVLWFETLLNS